MYDHKRLGVHGTPVKVECLIPGTEQIEIVIGTMDYVGHDYSHVWFFGEKKSLPIHNSRITRAQTS